MTAAFSDVNGTFLDHVKELSGLFFLTLTNWAFSVLNFDVDVKTLLSTSKF